MILNVWGRLKENIRIEELDLEIRNPLPGDELYKEYLIEDININFENEKVFYEYLRERNVLVDEDNCISSFLSGIIIMDLIPDDRIFEKSALCRANGGFPFLFCEDIIDERILQLLKMIRNSFFNKQTSDNVEPYIGVPALWEIYPVDSSNFHPKFGFSKNDIQFDFSSNFDEVFVSKMKNIFTKIDDFLKENENNYYTLDLILDAVQILEKIHDTKQTLLPCFSIIERTLISNTFSIEVEMLRPYAIELYKNPQESTKDYLLDIAILRNKLIHGEYQIFYKTLAKIHRKYFDSATWDASEKTPLNWCLSYVISDMTKICSNILYRKFVDGTFDFVKKRS